MYDGALLTTQPPCPPKRPVLRWHGGKWLLAQWIVSHFPEHNCYVEAFGGAASVLLRKARASVEIYNDLDDEVVVLFRILRNPAQAARLRQLLELTPFSRTEFAAAYEPVNDPYETARRLVVRSFLGFGHNRDVRTGFRARTNQSGTTASRDWMNYPDALPSFTERLRGVVVENRDAIEVMRMHDGDGTLHYCDPPYVPGTRSTKKKKGEIYHSYPHEMSADDHCALLGALKQLRGMVILSAYPSGLYDRRLRGWTKIERSSRADGGGERTEVLWLNPLATDRQPQPSFL